MIMVCVSTLRISSIFRKNAELFTEQLSRALNNLQININRVSRPTYLIESVKTLMQGESCMKGNHISRSLGLNTAKP